MAEKDVTEKILEDYPDVFADIFNTLVFNGELVIKDSELSESIVHSQYKAGACHGIGKKKFEKVT